MNFQDRRSRNDHPAPHSTHHFNPPQSQHSLSDQPHPSHYARNPSPRSAYEPFDNDGNGDGDDGIFQVGKFEIRNSRHL